MWGSYRNCIGVLPSMLENQMKNNMSHEVELSLIECVELRDHRVRGRHKASNIGGPSSTFRLRHD